MNKAIRVEIVVYLIIEEGIEQLVAKVLSISCYLVVDPNLSHVFIIDGKIYPYVRASSVRKFS